MKTERSEVFISYARVDAEFVIKLAEQLRAGGAAVWLDQLDIRPGDRWDQAVEAALMRCDRMLLILSPESVASNNVMDEVSYALEEKKQIIPVICNPCPIPFRLRRVQYIDLTRDYAEGVQRVLSALNVRGGPPPVVRETASPTPEPASIEPQRGAIASDLHVVPDSRTATSYENATSGATQSAKPPVTRPIHRDAWRIGGVVAILFVGVLFTDWGRQLLRSQSEDSRPPFEESAIANPHAFLDPRTAGAEELSLVPHLDAASISALIAARPLADMRAVDRVLAARLDERERDAVYARLWIPLDPNVASAEEILLIPGVGPRMQHEFVEQRPYDSIEQFRRRIGQYVDQEEVARLARYVVLR